MSVITFSSSLKVARCTWAQVRNDIEFRSAFGSQAVEAAGPLWAVTLEGTPRLESNGGPFKALGMQLRGKTNQLAMWDLARPIPLGTMRGTMTLNSAAAQGATTLSIIASGQASKTLLQGDYLGIGSLLTQQVVMVVEDATSDGSGIISVTVEPPLRNAFLAGESVTWDQPKALFRRVDSRFGWNNYGAVVDGFVLDLIEDWRT
ncbi:hypothetical protein SAMN05216420_101403 [Nitrosospira sp. Nl5]|uniref:hypothetical protein n=1 Tax=Nitrosospira sp. Nl5 TaxID=200120 RepID=UPI000885F955|nr:hypothetical protein [Nitrosospira sp. Nl5]SCX94324.1 hypothetical protein SAMN05216420_101403 [Nitrosospira sp. Nl5]